MSLINVTNVEILDNPTKFTNPFQFEITFECLAPGVQEGQPQRGRGSGRAAKREVALGEERSGEEERREAAHG